MAVSIRLANLLPFLIAPVVYIIIFTRLPDKRMLVMQRSAVLRMEMRQNPLQVMIKIAKALRFFLRNGNARYDKNQTQRHVLYRLPTFSRLRW